MNYEESYTSSNSGVAKTFRELSLQLIRDLGGKNEEHYLTRFKYLRPEIYQKLINFRYDKDKILSLITQVTLSFKMCTSTIWLNESSKSLSRSTLFNIITDPIVLLSDETCYQCNLYTDIVNYYYIMIKLLNIPSTEIECKAMDFARMIFNELVYNNDKFKKDISEKPTDCYIDSSAGRKSLIIEKLKCDKDKSSDLSFDDLSFERISNVKLVPIEHKDDYSSLFQNISFIRKDMIGGKSKVPVFYKALDCDDSDVRYKITQAHNVAVAVVRNPIYNSLIIEPITSDNMDTLKYEIKFGMNHFENDDVTINQLDGEDIYTFDHYLIDTQLRLNEDYQLTYIELKGEFELKRVLNVSYSKGPFGMIQIGIRWPFGIDSLNTALRDGNMTFILTIMKSV